MNNHYKLGLYCEDLKTLLSLTNVQVNAEIKESFAKIYLKQYYINNFDKTINAQYLFPKKLLKVFNSMKIEKDGKTYEGIISDKPIIEIKNRDNTNEIINDICDRLLDERIKHLGYFYFDIKDIEIKKNIAIEISYIQKLKKENNNKLIFSIPSSLFTPGNINNINYKYDYKINIINTKEIFNIICSKENAKINYINNNNIIIELEESVNDNTYNIDFCIEYDLNNLEKPELLMMRHPFYPEDNVFFISIIPKYLLKDYADDKIERNFIFLLSGSFFGEKINTIKKGLINAVKSIPENCSMSIYGKNEILEPIIINKENITKIINIINNINDKDICFTDLKKQFKLLKQKLQPKSRIFILDYCYNEHLNVDLTDIDAIIYTVGFEKYITDDEYLIENCGRREYVNCKKINNFPDKLITSIKRSLNDYITDIKVSLIDKVNDSKIIKKNCEINPINENLDIFINTSQNNSIKIEFKYKGKRYEYNYKIDFSNVEKNDMLHKIMYTKYCKELIRETDIINYSKKYQILSKYTEFYVEPKNEEIKYEEKINKKRYRENIFPPKGKEVSLTFKDLRNNKFNLTTYNLYNAEQIKKIININEGKFYYHQRYIYYGKSIEDHRTLEDYNVQGGIMHVVYRDSGGENTYAIFLNDELITYIDSKKFKKLNELKNTIAELLNYNIKELSFIYYDKDNNEKIDFTDKDGFIWQELGIIIEEINVYFKEKVNYDEIIEKQNYNGLWDANEQNFKLLNLGTSWKNFIEINKDIYLKCFGNINDDNIAFTILIIAYVHFINYGKREMLFIEKSFNCIMNVIKDYDMVKQKQFEKYLFPIIKDKILNKK